MRELIFLVNNLLSSLVLFSFLLRLRCCSKSSRCRFALSVPGSAINVSSSSVYELEAISLFCPEVGHSYKILHLVVTFSFRKCHSIIMAPRKDKIEKASGDAAVDLILNYLRTQK